MDFGLTQAYLQFSYHGSCIIPTSIHVLMASMSQFGVTQYFLSCMAVTEHVSRTSMPSSAKSRKWYLEHFLFFKIYFFLLANRFTEKRREREMSSVLRFALQVATTTGAWVPVLEEVSQLNHCARPWIRIFSKVLQRGKVFCTTTPLRLSFPRIPIMTKQSTFLLFSQMPE